MTLSLVLVGFILIQFYYPVNSQLLFIANLKHKYIKEDQKKTKVPSLLRYMIRYDFISKPGRQIVTFLILCNFGLWITYNFEIQKVIQCNIICRENNDFSGKCHSWSTAVLWILSLDYHSEGNTPDMRVFQVQYDNFLSL